MPSRQDQNRSGTDFSTDATAVPPAYAAPNFQVKFIPLESRRRVVPNDSLAKSLVRVFAYRAGETVQRKAGTAIFLSDTMLVTAAHVLFDPAANAFGLMRAGGYAGHVSLLSSSLAIPSLAQATTRIVAAPGYTALGPTQTPRKLPAADLALIKLNAPVPGAIPLTPAAVPPAQATNQPVRVYGYPAYETVPWCGTGACVGALPGLFYHSCDASDGQSGGALLLLTAPYPTLFAIHRAGPGETPSQITPSCGAVALTPDAIQWIKTLGDRL